MRLLKGIVSQAAAAPATGLKTNLVANWSLDEVSGNRSDSHTGSYTLTDTNTLGSMTAKISNGIQSDGSDYLTSASVPPATSALSCSYWIYPDAGTAAGLANAGIIEWGPGFRIAYTANGRTNLYVKINGANTIVNWDGSAFFAKEVWSHHAFVYDLTNIYYFINGVLRNKFAYTTTPTGAGTTYVGRDNGASRNLTNNAGMDELSIWDTALTHGTTTAGDTATGDIATLYNSGAGLAYASY